MKRTQAKFYPQDIVHTFLRLGIRASRTALVNKTGLGEGSIRTILNELKQKGLIESSKQGHWLSERGREWQERIKDVLDISEPRLKGFGSTYVAGFRISPPVNTKPSYILRDIAIKWGGQGALIFYFTGTKLLMPPSKEEDYEEDFDVLKKNLKRGDWFVLVWGNDRRDVMCAGLAIACELSETLRGFLVSLE